MGTGGYFKLSVPSKDVRVPGTDPPLGRLPPLTCRTPHVKEVHSVNRNCHVMPKNVRVI